MRGSNAELTRALSVMLALGLAACASGLGLGVAESGKEETERQRFIRLETEGDALATGGSLSDALDRYQRALVILTLYQCERYGFDLGPRSGGGVVLNNVLDDSVASKAGVHNGDVLTGVDGQPVQSMSTPAIRDAISDNPFRPLTLNLQRSGAALSIVLPHVQWGLGEDPSCLPPWMPEEWELVSKEVALYSRGVPAPDLPPSAREIGVAAQNAAKAAHTPEEVQTALDMFTLAQFVAPYWADLLVNEALVQKTSGDVLGAVRSLRFYLQLAPTGASAPAVRGLLAELEPAAARDAPLAAFEGVWLGPKGQGMLIFKRSGSTLTAAIGSLPPYIRANIVDAYTVRGNFITVPGNIDLSKMPAAWLQMFTQCFNQHMESAVWFQLSPDKRTMTEHLSDINVDPSNCAVTSNVESQTEFHRP